MAAAQGLVDRLLAPLEPAVAGTETGQQRFRDYLRAAAGPSTLLVYAGTASVGQWSNSPKEWGQGWAAYGKRYGDLLAYNASRQTISYGVATALKEDNRYFASGRAGFWGRAGNTLLATFTARRADGSTGVSVSSITGVVGASALSQLWQPANRRGVGNTAYSCGASWVSSAVTNLLSEFLPELRGRRR